MRRLSAMPLMLVAGICLVLTSPQATSAATDSTPQCQDPGPHDSLTCGGKDHITRQHGFSNPNVPRSGPAPADETVPASPPTTYVNCSLTPQIITTDLSLTEPHTNFHLLRYSRLLEPMRIRPIQTPPTQTPQLFAPLDPNDPTLNSPNRYAVCGLTFNGPPLADADPAAAEQAARDWIKTIALPVPRPAISARQGVTGAVHSLNLHMTPEFIANADSPFGPMEAHFYGVNVVNWGDGNTGQYRDGGADYPKSSITHTWTKTGTFDINVTSHWVAEWSIDNGRYRGAVVGMLTNGTIPAWPVGELQAVITH